MVYGMASINLQWIRINVNHDAACIIDKTLGGRGAAQWYMLCEKWEERIEVGVFQRESRSKL